MIRPPEDLSFRADKLDHLPSEIPRVQAELPPSEYFLMRAGRTDDPTNELPPLPPGTAFRRHTSPTPSFFDPLVMGHPSTVEMQGFDFEKIQGIGGDVSELAHVTSGLSGNDLFRDNSGTLLLPHFNSNPILMGDPAVNWGNPASLPSLSDHSLPLGSWTNAQKPVFNLPSFPPPMRMSLGAGDQMLDSMPMTNIPFFVPANDPSKSVRQESVNEQMLSDLPDRYHVYSTSRTFSTQSSLPYFPSGYASAPSLKSESSRLSKSASVTTFSAAEEDMLLSAVTGMLFFCQN